MIADFGIDDAPFCDLVIVTGGPGWTVQARAPATLEYIRRIHTSARIASVCTGSMILAASGVLDGGPATTKREVVLLKMSPLEVMRTTYPQIEVREAMLVDRGGKLVTGGGVLVSILRCPTSSMLGQHVSDETARIMEYQRASRANRDGFGPVVIAQ